MEIDIKIGNNITEIYLANPIRLIPVTMEKITEIKITRK